MKWIPSETDFLTVFGGVLAAAATLFGLLAALGQHGRSARAHKAIEWTTAALAAETNDHRRLALDHTRLRAQGRLVAAQYVPLWRFHQVALWIWLAPGVVLLSAGRGKSPEIGAVLMGVVTLGLIFRGGIRLYAERQRVAFQYVLGEVDVEPVRVDILEQMEGGTRQELWLGWILAISVMGTAAVLAWGIVEGRSTVWAWVILGVVSCALSLGSIHTYAQRTAQNPPPHAAEV